ncbi:dienelactone hydrolase family protein [Desertibaculum subflavum]|uniref:dienelactone hydrolase family protein n=1 Tax=Desertibaculum subflavum TaxID=2268458 RepID=UPI000E664152
MTSHTGNRFQISKRAIDLPPLGLAADLTVPSGAWALIVFAHGSGSSRLSPRNRAVAAELNARGMATLLFDLLTPAEEGDRRLVFDIPLLAQRLVGAVAWLAAEPDVRRLPVGLFGASTGAAAALVAAAELPERIGAVVSRGGRPDLAEAALPAVRAPVLLLVGGADTDVLALNRAALEGLSAAKSLVVIPDASHLFPEPGAMQAVTDHAARWFERHLAGRRSA